jgi:hypothetical protein
MDGIGSLGALASQAARPFAVGGAGSINAAGAAGGSAPGAVNGAAFAMDYSMAVLAKVTHASADQALTLIQSLPNLTSTPRW